MSTEELIIHLDRAAGAYGELARGELPHGVILEWDQSNIWYWEAARALEAAQADLAARDAVLAGIHAIVDRERTFSESLSRDFDGNLFPQIVRLDTLRNALAQSPADALTARDAEKWDEGRIAGGQHALSIQAHAAASEPLPASLVNPYA